MEFSHLASEIEKARYELNSGPRNWQQESPFEIAPRRLCSVAEMHGRAGLLLLGLLPGSSALVYEAGVRGRSARRSSRSRVPTASLSSWEMSAGGVAMQSSSAGGGIMVDGMRIGPPPDMPSLLLSNRIVYLGTPIASQVTELTNSDSLEVKVVSMLPVVHLSRDRAR